ncbi:hypothetical protein [Streptomyces chattanoogensis]|uniref:hypothetical protein n=1 Tax=Streptomyces chattanoogensis TaxID=66876 RepID=UPI000AFDB902|nr:hypothetical protein [Streptomyces chattanoogensis]
MNVQGLRGVSRSTPASPLLVDLAVDLTTDLKDFLSFMSGRQRSSAYDSLLTEA